MGKLFKVSTTSYMLETCSNKGWFLIETKVKSIWIFGVWQSSTTSWGCWKHPLWIPGVRPMFLKPKLHKQSKNGFKTISCRRYPLMIFSKNCFSVQNNHQKNWMFCWFLNFYGNIYDEIRPVLINLIAGCSESIAILPKS